MLDDRRRELQAEVQGKMRDVRAEGTWGGKQSEVFDAVESSEADIQDDLEFALIQMKSETLNKIVDALALEPDDRGVDVFRRMPAPGEALPDLELGQFPAGQQFQPIEISRVLQLSAEILPAES